ncbi:MAG: VRR-NUC domain-containing protein [Anaerolineales bacterium]|nr:VRR-NUC domain-containing protein [Anaerolineales bacterium]
MTGKTNITEQSVQNAVIDYLLLHGWLILRVNAGAVSGEYQGKKRFVSFVRWFAAGIPSGQQTKGVADIIAVSPDGRFAAFEIKRPGGRVRKEQRDFLAEVRARGGMAAVIDSIDTLRGIIQ